MQSRHVLGSLTLEVSRALEQLLCLPLSVLLQLLELDLLGLHQGATSPLSGELPRHPLDLSGELADTR